MRTATTLTPADLEALGRARRLLEDGTARRLRLAAHLGAAETARALGISAQLYNDWEHGRRLPAGEAGARFAAFLDRLMAAGS